VNNLRVFLLRHLWSFLWDILLEKNLIHTRFGQWVERNYLRASLPKVRAFEVVELPVVPPECPLDELVYFGVSVPIDGLQIGTATPFDEQTEPWPVVFDDDDDCQAGGHGLSLAEVVELYVCATCHKPADLDGRRVCEPCAFEELKVRVGA
jgi:hypothetical protein